MTSRKMKLLLIVGARPQFIKLSPLVNQLGDDANNLILHTGQHFDQNMSDIFFNQMGIPKPDIHLAISGGTHAAQTGKMLIEIEHVYLKEHPDLVIVFGDTNSTLAGALAAAKLHIPILHIEAGLRSFDMKMPEEQNRLMTDRISTYLSCPSENAVQNLKREGITDHVYNTGDIMFDATIQFLKKSQQLGIEDKIKETYPSKEYNLLTLHRPSNTDYPEVLQSIFDVLSQSKQKIVFPVHPRTKKSIEKYKIEFGTNIQMIEPVGYLEMLALTKNAKKVITDSGGLQKEAMFLKTPCITVRDTTEWIETVDAGWNYLVKDNRLLVNQEKLAMLLNEDITTTVKETTCYGTGKSAQKIIDIFNK